VAGQSCDRLAAAVRDPLDIEPARRDGNDAISARTYAIGPSSAPRERAGHQP
jgi:hypothetical protein